MLLLPGCVQGHGSAHTQLSLEARTRGAGAAGTHRCSRLFLVLDFSVSAEPSDKRGALGCVYAKVSADAVSWAENSPLGFYLLARAACV